MLKKGRNLAITYLSYESKTEINKWGLELKEWDLDIPNWKVYLKWNL